MLVAAIAARAGVTKAKFGFQKDTVLTSTRGMGAMVPAPTGIPVLNARQATQSSVALGGTTLAGTAIEGTANQTPAGLHPPGPLPIGTKLPTPVNADKLEFYLQGYPQDKIQYLVNGFRFGFPLGFKGERTGQNCKNSKSAMLHPDIVSQKLQKEIAAGRIAGPFDSKPFQNIHLSPLGLVPKKNGDFRLIHNLSFSENQGVSSINEGIPREMAQVKYAGVDDAVRCLKSLGTGAYMVKVDILQAFRQLPVAPRDYPLLGFTWGGKFYYDKCLVMGASSSCKSFEALSTALEWIMLNKLAVPCCVHCLDDFWTAHTSKKNVSDCCLSFWLCVRS